MLENSQKSLNIVHATRSSKARSVDETLLIKLTVALLLKTLDAYSKNQKSFISNLLIRQNIALI